MTDKRTLAQMGNAMASAVEKAGGAVALCRLMGGRPSRQAIESWAICPAHRVLQISDLTGVPVTKLRPDIYPPERFS